MSFQEYEKSMEGLIEKMGYTLIENAKAHNLKTYDYLKFVLESRPTENMTDAELENIAPWSEAAQAACCKTQE